MSEGRVVAAGVVAYRPPVVDGVSNGGLSAAIGADIVHLNHYDVDKPMIGGLPSMPEGVEAWTKAGVRIVPTAQVEGPVARFFSQMGQGVTVGTLRSAIGRVAGVVLEAVPPGASAPPGREATPKSACKAKKTGGLVNSVNHGSEERYLVIQADDFGMTRGINRGIIKAFEAGVITNTTLLVTMPYAEEAAQLAKDHPQLGVGLHLSLTNGRPVLSPKDVPSLVDEQGGLLRRPERVYPVAKPEDMLRELEAQFERFLALGLRPSHIDTHHAIHDHPAILKILLDMAHDQAVPIRCLGRSQAEVEARKRDIPFPNWYRDLYFEEPKPAFPVTPSRVLEVIHALKPGLTDLGCHIGYVDDELAVHTSYVEGRQKELESLLDGSVKTAIHSQGIHLVDFRYLKADATGHHK